jgi:multiple sugar transport system permease protein
MIKKRKIKIRWQQIIPYLFLAPTLALLIFIWGYSWVYSLRISFSQYIPYINLTPKFIGLDNYITLFKDPLFLKTLKNSVVFTGISVFFQIMGGLGIALGLSRLWKSKKLFTTIALMPMILAPVLVGLMWKLFYDIEFGLLNYFLNSLGFPKLGWIATADMVLPSVIFVNWWRSVPFVIIFLFAGLQALPQEPFEAAIIDGASRLQRLRHLTLPMLRPLIAIVLLFQTAFTLRAFDDVFILARGGGPDKNAMLLGIYLYERGFRLTKLGYAASISFVILGITLLVGLFYLIMLYKEMEF